MVRESAASALWQARVRTPSLDLVQPISYAGATLVENFNAPDMLSLTGSIDRLAGAALPGYGVILTDDARAQRFSGSLTSIEVNGDTKQFNLTYASDLACLWRRIVWPSPGAAWATGSQTSAFDTQVTAAETKLLHYIDYNAGPNAFHATTPTAIDRRVAHLRLPATLGRGPTGATTARFEIVGQLAADLAESAGLRLTVEQSFTGLTPYLDVKLTDAPDMSASIHFGTAASAPLKVGQAWRYKISAPAVDAALGAGDGVGVNRILGSQTDATALALWGRSEAFVSLSSASTTAEVANSIQQALDAGKGPVEVAVPLPNTDLVNTLPIGSRVAVTLATATVVDRIRQRTTVLGGDPSVAISVVFGSPDAGLANTPTQKALAAALRRIQALERT